MHQPLSTSIRTARRKQDPLAMIAPPPGPWPATGTFGKTSHGVRRRMQNMIQALRSSS
jgi:hypothetical protein